MVKPISALCTAALLLVFSTAPALAADSLWNGTWKLNQDKSKFTGETFTLSALPSGMMHFTNSSTLSYEFACDGKDYPTLADRTVACSKNSDGSYDSVSKVRGTVVSKAHRSLSAEGKTLTVDISLIRPDGKSDSETDVYTRVTPGTGVAGKWKNVKSVESTPDIMNIKLTPPNGLHWDIPAYKESVDGKIDGSPCPMLGPRVPQGLSISFKKVTDNKLTYQVKLNDKPLEDGEQVLSADGKSLSDTSWVSGKPTEKTLSFYEKQ